MIKNDPSKVLQKSTILSVYSIRLENSICYSKCISKNASQMSNLLLFRRQIQKFLSNPYLHQTCNRKISQDLEICILRKNIFFHNSKNFRLKALNYFLVAIFLIFSLHKFEFVFTWKFIQLR